MLGSDLGGLVYIKVHPYTGGVTARAMRFHATAPGHPAGGDVSKEPRYLESFPDTRSEIVVPILRGGTAIGGIDIDSKVLDAFRPEDRAFLERVAPQLADIL